MKNKFFILFNALFFVMLAVAGESATVVWEMKDAQGVRIKSYDETSKIAPAERRGIIKQHDGKYLVCLSQLECSEGIGEEKRKIGSILYDKICCSSDTEDDTVLHNLFKDNEQKLVDYHKKKVKRAYNFSVAQPEVKGDFGEKIMARNAYDRECSIFYFDYDRVPRTYDQLKALASSSAKQAIASKMDKRLSDGERAEGVWLRGGNLSASGNNIYIATSINGEESKFCLQNDGGGDPIEILAELVYCSKGWQTMPPVALKNYDIYFSTYTMSTLTHIKAFFTAFGLRSMAGDRKAHFFERLKRLSYFCPKTVMMFIVGIVGGITYRFYK